jgi:hypothetical protein
VSSIVMTPPRAAGQPIRIVVSRRHAALHAEFDLVEPERD